MTQGNVRLQPWRYLHELVVGLRSRGHEVTLISDVDSGQHGSVVVRGVRRTAAGNPPLERALWTARPDVTFWNVGFTSALHLATKGLPGRSVAVLTSPVHCFHELMGLGLRRLWQDRSHSPIHLLGAALPPRMTRRFLSGFDAVIVESEANQDALNRMGVDAARIIHAPPGVDEEFRPTHPPPDWEGPFTLLFLGSPLPVRGVTDLVDAMGRLPHGTGRVHLRILARGRALEAERLERRIRRAGVARRVSVQAGLLSRSRIAEEIRAAHVVALPFRLAPSDVPLAVLEALACGRPVLASRVACIREYVAGGGALVTPGSVPELVSAISSLATERDVYERAARAACEIGRQLPRWRSVADRILTHEQFSVRTRT